MPTLTFSEEEKKAFRAAFAPTATEEQWSLFINECQRRALIPGQHVIFTVRGTWQWDPTLGKKVPVSSVAFMTTIAALRLIAARSGHYKGHKPFTYVYKQESDALLESKIPLGRIPHAVTCEFRRDDWAETLFAVARYDACVQLTGGDEGKHPNSMWTKRGEEQLAKCCEAAGLRELAPEDCAGLYIEEEFARLEREEEEPQATVAAVELPKAMVVPTVNQARAEVETASPVTSTSQTAPVAAASLSQPAPVAVSVPLSQTEAGMREIDKMMAAMDKQTHNDQPVAKPKPETPAPPMGGLFDEKPATGGLFAPVPETPASAPKTPETPISSPTPSPAAPVAAVETVEYRSHETPEGTRLVTGPAKSVSSWGSSGHITVLPAAPVDVLPPLDNQVLETGKPSPPAPPKPVASGEEPASATEHAQFMARLAKIVRDVLPKAGLKDHETGPLVLAWLAAQSGKPKPNKIPAAKFGELLSRLEGQSPEAVLKILKS